MKPGFYLFFSLIRDFSLYLLSDTLKPYFGCFLSETERQCWVLENCGDPGLNLDIGTY